MVESKGTITLHAVLVKVNDSGVLITGESGSGKSETALGLISKGHSLIADDVVEITRLGDELKGSGPERFRRLLNLRDIGFVDVVELLGDEAYAAAHSVDVVIDLLKSSGSASIAEAESMIEILGIKIPKYAFSSDGTRNLALLIETIVKLLNKPQAIKTIDSI